MMNRNILSQLGFISLTDHVRMCQAQSVEEDPVTLAKHSFGLGGKPHPMHQKIIINDTQINYLGQMLQNQPTTTNSTSNSFRHNDYPHSTNPTYSSSFARVVHTPSSISGTPSHNNLLCSAQPPPAPSLNNGRTVLSTDNNSAKMEAAMLQQNIPTVLIVLYLHPRTVHQMLILWLIHQLIINHLLQCTKV